MRWDKIEENFDSSANLILGVFILSTTTNKVVDATPSRCEESFAYLTDVYEYALIVYDFKRDKSWRIDHHYFHFDPVQGNLHVDGVNFQWHDGIFGMALGDVEANGWDDRIHAYRILNGKVNWKTFHNFLFKQRSNRVFSCDDIVDGIFSAKLSA